MIEGFSDANQEPHRSGYYRTVRVLIVSLMFLVALVLIATCDRVSKQSPVGSDSIERAFAQHARDVQVEGEGIVSRILADDRSGSPHQRFIVRLASGQTVLIAHNIELAARVDGLKEGDAVAFFGEYVWNEQGGSVHWTHRDPMGKHVAGWVKHNGRTYQ